MRASHLAIVAILATTTPTIAADLVGGLVPPSGNPAYAPSSMVFGHFSLGVGILDPNSPLYFGGNTLGVFEGTARVNAPLGSGGNIEFETGGKGLFHNGSSISDYGVAGHVWTRLHNTAVGIFGGVNFPFDSTVYTAGVEGEVNFGNVAIGADADYNWQECGGCGTFWTLGGWADYYFNPDFRLGATFDYGAGDIPDSWSAGVDTEYRFSGTPFSVWAQGSYSSLDCCGDPDLWQGMAGFRFFMDPPQTTLKEHNHQVPWKGLLKTPLAF